MRIVVLVKCVPDTWGERSLSLETGLAERGASEVVVDEIGERAVEVALAHADVHPGTEVTVLSMAPEASAGTIRKALAMGAGSATQVVDERLVGADLALTAEVLASALRHTGFDLVIAGEKSTDGSGGVIPAMLAELLDVPAATALGSVEIDEGRVTGVRASDGAAVRVSATLPAVVSVTEAVPEGRFPNFKGIMAAKKKPFTVLSLDELGIDADEAAVPRAIMTSVAERPARAAGVTVVDDGSAATELARYLIRNQLA